jgi:hypothetical protein
LLAALERDVRPRVGFGWLERVVLVHRTTSLSACAVLACAALGCAPAARETARPTSAEAPELIATPLAIEAPPQSDAAPQWALAFEYQDGRRVALEERALAFSPFRGGVALIDVSRRLLLISPDGSRRTLSSTSVTTPVLGPSGELYYAARYGTVVELHRLSEAGRDDVIARELSSIGLLAPQADASVLMVGARNGGVAGIWRVAPGANEAQCATNCELKTGEPWGDRFVPPPGTRDELESAYRAAQTIDGDQGVLGGEP